MPGIEVENPQFIDKITKKRIENWCAESEVAFRRMAEEIGAEKGPNTRYEIIRDGVYQIKV
jgi:hypothetical protein